MEHAIKVCSINFFVSVRTLTVLAIKAIKVISVKRLLGFIVIRKPPVRPGVPFSFSDEKQIKRPPC